MAATVTTNGNPAPASPTVTPTEWPASATIRVTSPKGLDVLLTLRAARVADVLTQLETLEGWLIGRNWTPAPTPKGAASPSTAGQGNGQAQGEGEPAAICDTCGRPMKQKPRRDGKGYFWSCETKYGAEWCKGRPRK